eukprot:Clim_evm31s152 gene=Clim_evmTU31s152
MKPVWPQPNQSQMDDALARRRLHLAFGSSSDDSDTEQNHGEDTEDKNPDVDTVEGDSEGVAVAAKDRKRRIGSSGLELKRSRIEQGQLPVLTEEARARNEGSRNGPSGGLGQLASDFRKSDHSRRFRADGANGILQKQGQPIRGSVSLWSRRMDFSLESFHCLFLRTDYRDIQKDEAILRLLKKHYQITEIRDVPMYFADDRQYFETWLPLLFLEGLGQILQALEEERQDRKGKRDHTYQVSVVDELRRESNPWYSSFMLETSNDTFNAIDDYLCALEMPKPGGHGFYRVFVLCSRMGYSKILRMKISFTNASKLRPETYTIVPLCRLTPFERQFVALKKIVQDPPKHISHIRDLLFEPLGITRANNSRVESHEPETSTTDTLNDLMIDQSRAARHIMSAKDHPVFVQGPPGTGKTRTIVHVITALFKNLCPIRKNPWLPNPSEVLGSDPSKADSKVRVMICTQSNAALIEICQRLGTGLETKEKGVGATRFYPRVVRFGNYETTEDPMALENLVEKFMKSDPNVIETMARIDKLRIEGEKSAEKLQANEKIIKALNARLESRRGAAVKGLMLNTDVIACTLVSSGHPTIEDALRGVNLNYILIDEAAQAVELESVIPTIHKHRTLAFVGDPMQLPATVVARKALKRKYDMSFFQRLVVRLGSQSQEYVHRLKVQFRMLDPICRFPSKEFYDNQLVTSDSVEDHLAGTSHFFQPLSFIECRGKMRRVGSGTLQNLDEVEVMSDVLNILFRNWKESQQPINIAILTPYRGQLSAINRKLVRMKGGESKEFIDECVRPSTIDGFQGQECDVCIFLTVRSSHRHSLGFVSDMRRLNVAITRSRFRLIIIGDDIALGKNKTWKRFLHHIRHNGKWMKLTDLSPLP